MVEDTPDEYIFDFFGGLFWNGHPLGYPILGTKESVQGLTRASLLDFFRLNYPTDNLVIAATGNLKHDELVGLVQRLFGDLQAKKISHPLGTPATVSRVAVIEKELEQVHAIIGTLSPSFTSPSRYAGFLLNTVLGGSMSSRLFQEIREKRGLAYSIHSYLVSYQDVGKLGIYVGTGEDKLRQVFDLILAELKKMRTECLSDEELRCAKEQIKGNFLLGMESTDNRMTRLAKNELYFDRHVPAEETLEHVDAVKKEDILNLSNELFRPETLSVAALGKVSRNDLRLEAWQ